MTAVDQPVDENPDDTHPADDRRRGNWAWLRSLALTLLLGTIGGALALWLVGPVHVGVGPLTVGVSIGPAAGGPMVLDLAPLGEMSVAPHYAPVGVRAEVVDFDPATVSDVITKGRTPSFDVGGDLPRTLAGAAGTLIGAAALGGALVAGIARRSWLHALLGAAGPFIALSACFWIAVATFNGDELGQPTTTGALALVPEAATSATRFLDHQSSFSDSVGKSTDAASDLYLGLFGASDADHPDTVRILHISDLHLNAAALRFAGRLAKTFDVDVVANTGDDADWGSDVESDILGGPVGLDVPYLWVRGNHDTLVTQERNAAEGATVLDGTETTVDGLTFFGVGDPTFSPKLDMAVVKEGQTKFKRRWSTETMVPLYDAQPQVPDVVMTHDPAMTDAIEPKPPLRLAGHTHKLKVSAGRNPDGSPWVLVVNGSTGGAGLRVLDRRDENPMSAVIVTVDKATGEALYLDEFSYRPLTDQTFKVRRVDLKALVDAKD